MATNTKGKGRIALLLATTPSVLGTTTLPEVELAHRWTIDNAEVFMTRGKAILEKDIVIKSPEFTTNYTPKGVEHSRQSRWRLCINRSARNRRTVLSLEALAHNSNTKVLVSQCRVSFIDSRTSEVKYSKTAPLTELRVNSRFNVEIEPLFDKYFCNGALTIQVDATLLEVSRPNETVNKAYGVPRDSIRSEMHTLFKMSILTDTTIKCGKEEFKVHKAILASQSPLFRKMFETDMKEKKSEVVDLSDYSQPIVSDLVTYLYTGSAPSIGSLAYDLLTVASMYELHRLFVMCENELMMKI